jgi:parallel beta-helix repeat protein
MKKIIVILITIGFCFLSISPASGEKIMLSEEKDYDDYQKISEKNFYLNYVNGEIIVKFKNNLDIKDDHLGTSISSINQLNNKYEVDSIEQFEFSYSKPTLSNVYKLKTSYDADVYKIIEDYNLDPNVEYAEPNYLYRPCKLPNDPLFNQQWALHQENDCDVDAPEAWDINTGSPEVVIAVIDTGIDYNHEDIKNNLWYDSQGNPGYDFVDIDTEYYSIYGLVSEEDYVDRDGDPMDLFGHGTHCAGIIGAIGNNNLGVSGVCWNCKIMALRNGFLIEDGATAVMEVDDSAEAIIYAVDNGADIISMSWSSPFSSNLINDALDYAYENNVALIAAASNEGSNDEFYPAANKKVIAVGATDENDKKASFSNYGDWVDIYAPGVNILSLRAKGTDMYNSGGKHVVGGSYYLASGTSMACPYVAGIAGLFLSMYQNCPHPAHVVKSIISNAYDEMPENNRYINNKRINTYKVLTNKVFTSVLDGIVGWEDTKEPIEIKGTAWGEGFQKYELRYGKGDEPYSWTNIKISSEPETDFSYTLDTTNLDEGLYTIRLTTTFNHGTYYDEFNIYINNEADGTYPANIYVSNCYDQSTPGFGTTRFNTIQKGINKAKNGDIVYVHDGIYQEKIDCLLKSIKLIGQNRDWTIIEGSINISFTQNVVIEGFTIRYGSWTLVGYPASLMLFTCSKCTVKNNKIISFFNGISLWAASDNVVKNNICIGKLNPCIDINQFSKNNKIHDNQVLSSEMGFLLIGNNNEISKNIISDNYYGIYVDSHLSVNSVDNNIHNNQFINNIIGMYCWEVTEQKIIANNFTRNECGLCFQMNGHDNEIYCNNFIDNDCTAVDWKGKDKWYIKTRSAGKGNYWDDYTGTDDDGDGIGDTPYKIPGEYNEDKYPFMEPIDIDKVKINKEKIKPNTYQPIINKLSFLNGPVIRLILKILKIL